MAGPWLPGARLQACQRSRENCKWDMSASYGFLPGSHAGLKFEFASHSTGSSIDLIESVMCAKSIVFTSSEGW